MPDDSRFGINLIQASVFRANPKIIIPVFADSMHKVAAQTIQARHGKVPLKLIQLAGVIIDAPKKSAYPGVAFLVFIKVCDNIIADGKWISVLFLYPLALIPGKVVYVQTAFCTKPKFWAWLANNFMYLNIICPGSSWKNIGQLHPECIEQKGMIQCGN